LQLEEVLVSSGTSRRVPTCLRADTHRQTVRLRWKTCLTARAYSLSGSNRSTRKASKPLHPDSIFSATGWMPILSWLRVRHARTGCSHLWC